MASSNLRPAEENETAGNLLKSAPFSPGNSSRVAQRLGRESWYSPCSPLRFRFPGQEQVDKTADDPKNNNQNDADEAVVVREESVLNAVNERPDPKGEISEPEHCKDTKY